MRFGWEMIFNLISKHSIHDSKVQIMLPRSNFVPKFVTFLFRTNLSFYTARKWVSIKSPPAWSSSPPANEPKKICKTWDKFRLPRTWQNNLKTSLFVDFLWYKPTLILSLLHLKRPPKHHWNYPKMKVMKKIINDQRKYNKGSHVAHNHLNIYILMKQNLWYHSLRN
jgi:hypothetical protein